MMTSAEVWAIARAMATSSASSAWVVEIDAVVTRAWVVVTSSALYVSARLPSPAHKPLWLMQAGYSNV